MWGKNGSVYWYNPTQVVTVAVDSDSYITNSYTANGAIFGYNVATNVRFTGTGNLTVYEPAGVLSYLYLTTNDTTYAGSWRILKGAWCFPDLATNNGTAGWTNSDFDLVSADSQLRLSRNTSTWSPYFHKKITGNGSVYVPTGYGANFRLDAGGVIAPGLPNQDDVGTITFPLSANDTVYFLSNSEYQVNVLGTASADLIAVTGAKVPISAGAKLTVKLWTPDVNVPNLSVNILTCTNTLTTNQGFTVTWQNTANWSNLAVNYDITSTVRRVYVTGAYTAPGGAHPTVTNDAVGATNVLNMSAVLNGTLVDNGSLDTSVWAFWDTSDRQTNKTWTYSHPFGVQSVGALPYQATGLLPNTQYWYAYYASNTVGESWGQPSVSFRTGGPPGVDNGAGATAVAATNATLNGTLTNGTTAHVFIYWGTDQANLSNTNDLAARTQGAFAAAIAGLSPGTVYWYRCLATNAYGTVWADSATNFTTLVPHTYNDKTNGLWSDTNTWFSSDGGTSFPQQVCDTAIIDSHTVDVTIPNPMGIVYLRTGGVMRVGNNAVGGCTNAQATLHLAGGTLDMWAGSGHGCNWYNSYTNLDLVVDAGSVITNSCLTASGAGIGGGNDTNAVRLTGSGTLTLSPMYFNGSGSYLFMNMSPNSSTFSGAYRFASTGMVCFPNPPLSGTAGWQGSDFELVTTNSTLRLGRTSATWLPYIQRTISGNGRLAVAGSGYGNHLHLDNGGVLAPGRPNTDDAGTLTVAMTALENFFFESNSEYRANIVNTNLADLVDIGPSPTYINPGAKLTVKLWTPNAGVPSLTATILTCTNTLTTNQGFAVTWVNTNRWTGLAVNYDTASTPRRVYVTGTYTPPPAAGTLILFR